MTEILFVISVDDYHELNEFADAIRLPDNKRVKAVEAPGLGNDGDKYWGVLSPPCIQ